MKAVLAISNLITARRIARLKAYLCTIMALLSSQAQSQSVSCQFSVETPEMIVLSAAQVMSGDYSKFASVIDPDRKLPDSIRDKLSDGLEEYAPDGFVDCVLLKQESHPNFATSWLLFSSDEAYLFMFLAVAKIRNEWLTVKVQVSSDFDEVYSFVR